MNFYQLAQFLTRNLEPMHKAALIGYLDCCEEMGLTAQQAFERYVNLIENIE